VPIGPGRMDKGCLPHGRGITLGGVSFRPGSLEGVQTSPTGGRVEYLRAARNLGRPSGEQCPICEEADLVEVTFVFGSRLPSGGRCVATQTELTRYWRRKDPVVCYVVEVCAECSWNHLARMYPAGAGVETVARKPMRGRASL